MADTGVISSKIVVDSTGVATATKDLTDIKKILTDIASNTKGALADEFKSMGNEADKVVKKISAIKTVEQELEQQISRTKRAYQLANDADAVEKLAARRKISEEKAQAIYDRALESRSTKLQSTSTKIMDGEIALGKTYAKNIGLLEQTIRLLGLAGKGTGDLTEYTKGVKVDQSIAKASLTSPKTEQTQSYVGYVAQLSAAKAKAEEMHQVMTKLGTQQSKIDFANAKKGVKEAEVALNNYNRSMDITHGKLTGIDAFMQKFKSHARWIAAGAAIGAIIAIPAGALETIKDVELAMAGIRQVLQPLHDDQEKLNKASLEFIGIASQYGLEVNDIIESAKLWARAYKDVDTVMALVHSSSILAKADNFSLTEANKSLEGIMLQYGVRIKDVNEANKESMRIVDSITNVSHNAMISAQDLSAANIRSASAARQAGVSFDFLQGIIGTMARNTGRSGGEIGNAIRSMLVSIHSDKAVAEIEKLGISMYKVGEDGTKSFRNVQEVITELMLVSDSTDKNIEKMLLAASGGKFQYNKVASLIGDYNELIRVTDLSINSQGVASRQAEMQINTIASKLTSLKAQLESVVVGVGNAGITQVIKDVIDSIGIFVGRLSSINGETWQTIEHITRLAVEAKILSYAFSRLSVATGLLTTVKNAYTTATSLATTMETRQATALALTTIACNTNATAEARMNAMKALSTIETNAQVVSESRLAAARTIATGGLNLLVPLLLTGAVAYGMMNTESAESLRLTKENIDAEAKYAAQLSDKATATEQEIDIMQSKISFAKTLITTIPRLIAQQADEKQGTEAYIKTSEKLQTSKEALLHTIGEEAYRRVEAAGFTKEAIETEVKSIKDAQEVKAKALKDERKTIFDHSMAVKNQAQDRLDAIKAETSGLAIEAEKQALIYEGMAGEKYSRLKYEMEQRNKEAEDYRGELASGITTGNRYVFQRAEEATKAFNDYVESYKSDTANIIKVNLEKAKSIGNPYAPSKLSGDEDPLGTVDPPTTKSHSLAIDNSGITTEKQELIDLKDQLKLVKDSHKTALEVNQLAMDDVEKQKNIYGDSVELSLKAQKLTSQRLDIESRYIEALKALESSALTQAKSDRANSKTLGDNGDLGQYADIILRASEKFGVSADLIAGVIQQESSGNYMATSSVGAQGLMQLMPDTARGLGVDNVYDPEQNIMGGTKYLRQQLDTFGNDVAKALAAYNAGPQAVKDYGGVPPYAETKEYVKAIMANNKVNNANLSYDKQALASTEFYTSLKEERRNSELSLYKSLSDQETKAHNDRLNPQKVYEKTIASNATKEQISALSTDGNNEVLQNSVKLHRLMADQEAYSKIIVNSETQLATAKEAFAKADNALSQDTSNKKLQIAKEEAKSLLQTAQETADKTKAASMKSQQEIYDTMYTKKRSAILAMQAKAVDKVNTQQSTDIAMNTNGLEVNNDARLNEIKLKSAYDLQRIYVETEIDLEQQLKDISLKLSTEVADEKKTLLKKQLEDAQVALNQHKRLVAENTKDIVDLEYAKDAKIREGFYSITQDVLIQGNSLKNVWKKLWTDLANDALKQIFRINNSGGGLLSSLFGLSSSSGRPDGVQGPLRANGTFANGGIVSQPTNALIGETGDEEAVVNLGKLAKGDSRQLGLLQYANSKLGTNVTANVSPRTMDIARQSSATQQLARINSEHLDKLDKQISLLTQQNNMMLHLINSGSQGNTVAQPIVMQQGMSDEALYSQIASMRSKGYKV